MTLAKPFGWLRPTRAAIPVAAPHTAPPGQVDRSARKGHPFFRWGPTTRRDKRPAMPDDALLQLAAEWVQINGGAIQSATAEGLVGTLADGSPVAYTRSAPHASSSEQTTLLAPGAPALEALFDAIARRASVYHLELEAPSHGAEHGAEAVARGAFVAPSLACTTCIQPGAPDVGHACGPSCPLAEGHFIVIGLARGVRDVRLETRTSAINLEYTFRLALSSHAGRIEEVLRICLDARTGESRPLLPIALLSTATPDPHIEDVREALHQRVATVEARVARMAQAAARLTRLQSLTAYQQRQEHVTRTYDRLLLESPERGAQLLEARERDVRRIAESNAVECDVLPLTATSIRVPMARARVRLVGGGEVVTEIDLLRHTLNAPRCVVCDHPWRVGARCAGGHVTCLSCSHACAHCGVRRCALCDGAPFAPCAACDSLSCSRCAGSTARGKHRLQRLDIDPPSLDVVPLLGNDSPSAHDLTLDDLSAMSERTWRRFLDWLLACEGFVHERNLDQQLDGLVSLYRRTTTALGLFAPSLSAAGTSLVVFSYRPGESNSWLPNSQLAGAERHAASLAGVTTVLVTTAQTAQPSAKHAGKHIRVLDRAGLLFALNQLRSSYRRQQEAHSTEQQVRADAAAHVRGALQTALTNAAARLDSHDGVASGAHATPGDSLEDLRQHAVLVQQALAAIETLIEDWECTFDPTAARDGSVTLLADLEHYAELLSRVSHLEEPLAHASAAFDAAEPTRDRDLAAWWAATREELALRARALAERCTALDPRAWRSFAQAHDASAAARTTELLAASGRAALRARRLLDEIDARLGIMPQHITRQRS